MGRIDDLVAELCPRGVEFKAIGHFAQLVRGNGMPKADFTDSGVGCIHYGQIYTHYGTWATETKSHVSAESASRLAKVDRGDVIVTNTSENLDDVCKAVAWLGGEQIVTGGHATVLKHGEDPKFLAYYFQTAEFARRKKRFVTGTKVMDVSARNLAEIRIPIPPLAIQHEIVAILDKMEYLQAELEAELELRRRQHGYYRDSLMKFTNEPVEWRPMGEVGEFLRGRRFTKADYVDEGVPCMHYGDIYTQHGTATSSVATHVRPELAASLRYAEYGDVVMVDVGETVDDVGKAVAWLGTDKVAIHDHCFAFRHPMNPSFVSHYMQTSMYRKAKAKYVARTKVKTLLMSGLAKVLIPIPSVEDQERIVTILDAFDSLVNDISIGLPAEIAARRRQYGHYRDRLLTFDEAV